MIGGTAVATDTVRSDASPFRRRGLTTRVAPFAVVAVIAAASMALPPGPASAWKAVVSGALLLAVILAFLLPWSRLPGWATVLVPLAYTASVVFLILATGATSGVGIVILSPLIWTALFHRRWESFCVVAAIVAAEAIVSVTPVVAPDAVIARRIAFWLSLGTMIALATHGLRDRIDRAHAENVRLEEQVRSLILLEDRDRIATDLQQTVIREIIGAELALDSAAALSSQPEVTRRIIEFSERLNSTLRLLRETIFGLEEHARDHSEGG
ncbi:MAG TPA: hypothetical protein VG650_06995 [Mycobacteriales bacterium]|nr:hypothetical protein [Mycobacteriales bacterium]